MLIYFRSYYLLRHLFSNFTLFISTRCAPRLIAQKKTPDDNVVRGSNAAIRDRQAWAVIRAVIVPATGRPGL